MTLRLIELVITLALVVIVITIIESFNRFHGIGFTLREFVLESMSGWLGIEITTGAVGSSISVPSLSILSALLTTSISPCTTMPSSQT